MKLVNLVRDIILEDAANTVSGTYEYSDVNELRIAIWDRLENNNKLLAKLVEEERILEVENLFKTGKRVST